eukprot:gnl/MRDRNA2_/MRDRNA2_100475_c0_seq1.p1 gnl/MRDRNA2_/MRDRNA2_100475_c0~~gnl/MRDRNA2_/MRDRNA2_100475_c0_seq1.p1  ORF type:complete len:198 (-),score=27.60 gnl/MRDRNA2_/MRDRNA2_100475_c0_seq1:84-677(-)
MVCCLQSLRKAAACGVVIACAIVLQGCGSERMEFVQYGEKCHVMVAKGDKMWSADLKCTIPPEKECPEGQRCQRNIQADREPKDCKVVSPYDIDCPNGFRPISEGFESFLLASCFEDVNARERVMNLCAPDATYVKGYEGKPGQKNYKRAVLLLDEGAQGGAGLRHMHSGGFQPFDQEPLARTQAKQLQYHDWGHAV